MKNEIHQLQQSRTGGPVTTLLDTLVLVGAAIAVAAAIPLMLRAAFSVPAVSPVLVLAIAGVIVMLRKRLTVADNVATDSQPDAADAIVTSIEREVIEISQLLEDDSMSAIPGARFRPLLDTIHTEAIVECSHVKRIDDRITELARAGALRDMPELKSERSRRFDRILDAYATLQRVRKSIVELSEHAAASCAALSDTSPPLEDAVLALSEECSIAERVTRRLDGEPILADSENEQTKVNAPVATVQ